MLHLRPAYLDEGTITDSLMQHSIHVKRGSVARLIDFVPGMESPIHAPCP